MAEISSEFEFGILRALQAVLRRNSLFINLIFFIFMTLYVDLSKLTSL